MWVTFLNKSNKPKQIQACPNEPKPTQTDPNSNKPSTCE